MRNLVICYFVFKNQSHCSGVRGQRAKDSDENCKCFKGFKRFVPLSFLKVLLRFRDFEKIVKDCMGFEEIQISDHLELEHGRPFGYSTRVFLPDAIHSESHKSDSSCNLLQPKGLVQL